MGQEGEITRNWNLEGPLLIIEKKLIVMGGGKVFDLELFQVVSLSGKGVEWGVGGGEEKRCR